MSSSENESAVFVDPEWIAAHLGDPAVRVVEVEVSRVAHRSRAEARRASIQSRRHR